MQAEHENPKKNTTLEKGIPEQTQANRNAEHQMTPKPDHGEESYVGSGKLKDKIAVVTGGDSGIGKAVCIAFAREGAHVVVAYHSEDKDAQETKHWVEKAGRHCVLVKSDISTEEGCRRIIDEALRQLGGKLDILVNNAAYQGEQVKSILEMDHDRVERTFKTNIVSMFDLIRLAVPHMREGGAIINVGSIEAYNPTRGIIDYSSTKGAIVSLTKGLAEELYEKGIRVNCVAPGPVWTPLVVTSFPNEKLTNFGENFPAGRPAMPAELAPSFVFLASKDANYISGEVLGVTGGKPLA